MLIVAHRGYSSRYPENTVLAFEQAVRAGADYIETDLRLSRDGAVMCCHDPDLKRIAGQADTIADMSLSSLRAVSVADGFSIPTLEEILKIAHRRVGVMLDVKVTTEAMLDRALALIENAGMTAHVMYGTRDIDHAVLVKKRRTTMAVLGMPGNPAQIPDFMAAGVDAVRVWEEDVTDGIAALIHEAGKQVWVTAGLRRHGETVGSMTPARLETLNALGIDAVLVNDPVSARRSIEKPSRGKHLQTGVPL
ncbi:MAG: glycerophosphodiester phosphodiesterase family protein [Rhodospirillales bacterium]